MRRTQEFTMRVFSPDGNAEEVKVMAHYLTPPGRYRPLCFWSKPHWYSWPRCVGVVDWKMVISVNVVGPQVDWVKQAGVRL
jgi:hypothetical protein